MSDRRSFIKGAATAMAGMFTGFMATQKPVAAKPAPLTGIEPGIDPMNGGCATGLKSVSYPPCNKEYWESFCQPMTPEQAEEARKAVQQLVRQVCTRQMFKPGMYVKIDKTQSTEEYQTLYDHDMTGCVKDVGHHDNNVYVWLHKLCRTVAIPPECLKIIPDLEVDNYVDQTRLYRLVQAGTLPGIPGEDFDPLAIRPVKPEDIHDKPDYGSHRRFWVENVPTVENGTTKSFERCKEEGKIAKDVECWPRSRQFALTPETVIGTAENLIEWFALRIKQSCITRDSGFGGKGPYSDEADKEEQAKLREALDDGFGTVFKMHEGRVLVHGPMLDRNHPIGNAYDEQLAKMRAKQAENSSKPNS